MAEILQLHPEQGPRRTMKLFVLNVPAEMPDEEALNLGQRVIMATWEGPIGGSMFVRGLRETDPNRVIVSALVTKPKTDERSDNQLSSTELESRLLIRAHYRGVFQPPQELKAA